MLEAVSPYCGSGRFSLDRDRRGVSREFIVGVHCVRLGF